MMGIQSGRIMTFLTIDKEPYLNLKLRTSMIRFANQRFIDIELLFR